jgi:hypothetical protein
MNALARLLPDFEPIGPARFHGVTAAAPLEPVEIDPATAIAEAEERGFRKGFEAAEAGAREREAEAAERHAKEIAEARQGWADGEAGRLAEQIPVAFEALQAALAEATARALLPLVEKALCDQALDALRETVAGLLNGSEPASLRITGPEDLIAPLRERLGEAAAAIEFVVGAETEVRAIAGSTILETQLRAWSDRLAKAVG